VAEVLGPERARHVLASILFRTNHVWEAWTSITGNGGQFGTSRLDAVGDRNWGIYTFVACRVDTVLCGIVNQKVSFIRSCQSKSSQTLLRYFHKITRTGSVWVFCI
jgi:hypothetical protein